jgi:hypothetical protein
MVAFWTWITSRRSPAVMVVAAPVEAPRVIEVAPVAALADPG